MTETRRLAAPPDADALAESAEAVAILRRDGVAVYPTDTFYGLGGNAFSAAAVERIYELKGRDRGKPLPIVVSGTAMAAEVASVGAEGFSRLAAAFWPGPLTLVLEARPVFPAALLGPGGTVALRAPALAWLRRLLDEAGFPLTATSANLSGGAEISDADEASRLFRGRADLFLDGGRTPGGAPSTLVDLAGREPRLLRPGAVSWDAVLAALNR